MVDFGRLLARENRVTVDFETRSLVNLLLANVSIYARHPSTHALCLAYKQPAKPEPGQWWLNLFGPMRQPIDDHGCPALIVEAIRNRWEFHAHNAAFERYIWHHVCHKRYGWPDIPLELWHCTAGKAAHANMPRSLGKLCVRLGMGDKGKDKDGDRLIKLLSVPQKMTAKRVKAGKTEWEDDHKEHAAFRAYNRQDVIAEEGADEKLPDWPEEERRIWIMDRRINERGIPFDRRLCLGAMEIHKEVIRRANVTMANITGNDVTACTQVQRLGNWVYNQLEPLGVSDFPATPDGKLQLGEVGVSEWIKQHDEDPALAHVIEALRLRLDAGSATVKKYEAAIDTADTDDRIRETMLYYGAPTGRWAGRGFQPHNFKRAAVPGEEYMQAIASGQYDLCEMLYDSVLDEKDKPLKSVMALLKACVRGIIKAPAGKKFIISDFSGIEARVLAWVAGSDKKCQLFRDNQDPYIAAACDIFGVKVEEIADWDEKKKCWKIKKEHKDKRQIGKVAELGLGYGMGDKKYVGSVFAMTGMKIKLEFATMVVNKWRAANPEITRLWSQVGKAAMHVVRSKKIDARGRASGTAVQLGCLQFRIHPKDFLTIRLPSGRDLFYYQARIGESKDFGGEPELQYKDGSKAEVGSLWQKTYGGKLVENIVQAISRDLLVHSMHLIEGDYPDNLILTVHDETVTEVDAEDNDAKDYIHKCMTTLPPWATGLPLGAETHAVLRYTK